MNIVHTKTFDSFFNGKVRLAQNRDGYRFSVDAVILARAALPRPHETVVDLGSGCGVISVLMAFLWPEISIWAVEIQASLANLARKNIADNQMQDRIQVLETDFRLLRPGHLSGPADLVVCNPPYRKKDSGRMNPHPEKAGARHEIHATLEDVCQTGARILQKKGRICLIYPAVRLADLIFYLRSFGLEPKTLRMIHSKSGDSASLVLLEAVKGGNPGMAVDPPLYIYTPQGDYTAEMLQVFSPNTEGS